VFILVLVLVVDFVSVGGKLVIFLVVVLLFLF
jgi:hypothetical protein